MVDLHVLARFLAHWESEEARSNYTANREILQTLSTVAQSLSDTLGPLAKSVDRADYQIAHDKIEEDRAVQHAQDLLGQQETPDP